MYKPVAPRPKKTNIVRARTGCQSCRQRRSKCDERKPACGRCVRRNKVCEYQTRLQFKYETFVKESPQDGKTSLKSREKPAFEPGSDLELPTSPPMLISRIGDFSREQASDDWAANFQEADDFGPSLLSEHPLFHSIDGNSYTSQSPYRCGDYGRDHDVFFNTPSALETRARFLSLLHDVDFPLPSASNIAASLSFQSRHLTQISHRATYPEKEKDNKPETTNWDNTLGFHYDPRSDYGLSSLFEPKYREHWQNKVLVALPLVFQELSSPLHNHPAMRQAVLALAACNLGRSLPEAAADMGSIFQHRPCREHQLRSCDYYLSSVGQVKRLLGSEYGAEAILILATLLLFSYIEMGTGSFGGFSLHVHGSECLITDQLNTFRRHPTGQKLMAIWVRLWSYRWWLKAPSMLVETGDADVLNACDEIIWTYDMRRESILKLLSESHRRNCRLAIIQVTKNLARQQQEDSNNTAGDIMADESPTRPQLDDCWDQLKSQTGSSDAWHSMLKLSDLPVDSFTCQRMKTGRVAGTGLMVEPLKFHSHEAAMNYAYYITTQMLQDLDLLHSYMTSDAMEDSEPINPWILTLLRIVAGMQPETCGQQNAYTIGIVSLLLTCLLHCNSLEAGLWIERWVLKFRELSIFEEGGTPISQTIDIIRTINAERREGRDVFVASDSQQSDGQRLESYNSQVITSLDAYGRDRRTGKFFHENIPIK